MTTPTNPLGLNGIEFVEFSSPDPESLHRLFTDFGFHHSPDYALDHYWQGDIHLIVNRMPGSFAEGFSKAHGPSISSMALRTTDAKKAQRLAISRGACGALGDFPYPAIFGIGESLIYFVDDYAPSNLEGIGFETIDHLTNNVPRGEMNRWADFYKTVFGFTEVRYFDIRGVKTGLQSYALRSPCGKFCIPINEGTEDRSQINEYLRDYRGAGIQHLAFSTNDILQTLRSLGKGIETLDIDDDYYATVFDRVPHVTEDHGDLKKHKILVDGDEKGYLLQIFTKNLIGPIFIEIIQRKNHLSFGEGNFGALFRSIERDQEKRGVL